MLNTKTRLDRDLDNLVKDVEYRSFRHENPQVISEQLIDELLDSEYFKNHTLKQKLSFLSKVYRSITCRGSLVLPVHVEYMKNKMEEYKTLVNRENKLKKRDRRRSVLEVKQDIEEITKMLQEL